MPTAAERNALYFLAAVAVIGGGVRVVQQSRFAADIAQSEHLSSRGASRSNPGSRRDAALVDRALSAQIAAIDSARALKPATRSRPSRRPRAADANSSPSEDVPTLAREGHPERPPLLVDVNRATRVELERLPRVGPALAQRIIDWREQHGPYHSIDDLRHVRGIGPATAALLARAVTF